MKTLPALAVAILAPALAWAAPQLGIEQAVKLAQDDLKSRGLTSQVYISSVVLEAGHWSVKWSGEIVLSPEKKESGLEIAMDGGLARIVKGPANRNPLTGTFDPNGASGLENHRTRSTRGSILDLKH